MQAHKILYSWWDTKKAMRMSAHDLQKKRENLWRELQPYIAKTPALSHLCGQDIDKFPVVTPKQIRNNVENWNSMNITGEKAQNAARNAENGGIGEILPGVIAGYSTGTAGKRGIFLASDSERAIYMGQSLAKLLPAKTIFNGVRIMLFLRANSRLYSSGKRAGFFQFIYCSLSLAHAERQAAIDRFKPNILIAPAHILVQLARNGAEIPYLQYCYYGAEPMGEGESKWLEQIFGVCPQPIYQATEGFLGSACKYGKLHLNEDSLNIEFEQVEGTGGKQIIVTDLRRKTQPIVRVKLDDFIELDDRPCECGFAGRVILPVAGRIQNLWAFAEKIVTPRQVTGIMEQALGAEYMWKAIASPAKVKIFLENSVANDRVKYAAESLAKILPAKCPVEFAPLASDKIETKRHRVLWSADCE